MNIYISLTSIYQNQHILIQTLNSILKQTIITNNKSLFNKSEQKSLFNKSEQKSLFNNNNIIKCYIYLSTEPYLIDTGFVNKKITNEKLITLLNNNKDFFEIKWCKNTGPYRKLLPLLKEKWKEDCLIITMDDDIVYHPILVENLVNDYNKYKCCINYRGYTMDYDKSIREIEYRKMKQKLVNSSLYNFSTNGAGTVWHPSFFHKTNDLILNKKLFMELCPTSDDIWYNFCRIANGISCYINNNRKLKPYVLKWNTTTYALYKKYNWVDNLNTENIKNVINKFIDLDYLQDI